MKNRLINSAVLSLLCIVVGFTFASCSDWNDVESIDIEQPNIKEQNPELYAKYIENLKEYKKSKHKVMYVWFDNSEKAPFSRGQHISSVPDSVDVIVLTHPNDLTSAEMREMNEVRAKGTTVIFTINYDDIKLNYDMVISEQPEHPDFLTHIIDTLQQSFIVAKKYNYDGISIGYKGKNTLHLTPSEKNEYIANQIAFISIIDNWTTRNGDKTLSFEGNPQYLVDKGILTKCKHIILPTSDATNEERLSYYLSIVRESDVPTDRFVIMAHTPSLDPTDIKTGFWADGSIAILSSAQWTMATNTDYFIAGMGVYNVSNDYYSVQHVYRNTKGAMNLMNPSN